MRRLSAVQDTALPTVAPEEVAACPQDAADVARDSAPEWVIYGDDAVVGLSASDYVANFRGVQPALHGVVRITTEALKSALLPGGLPLGPAASDAAEAHAYLLVGANDILVNFPPRVATLRQGSPSMQVAAQRVANGTTALAAGLLSAACAERVTIVALPPQPYSLDQVEPLPITLEINERVAQWADAADGIDVLDCSAALLSADGRLRQELYLSGGSFGLSVAGEEALMGCLATHFGTSSTPAAGAPSAPFVGLFGPPTRLPDVFTEEEREGSCRPNAEATCFPVGAKEVPLPRLPNARDECAAWQV